jgi:nitroreductase
MTVLEPESAMSTESDTSVSPSEHIRRFRLFWPSLRSAIRSYTAELRYFYRVKASNLGRPLAEYSRREMLIKKRAHHLERFLFHPELYGEAFGASMARELEALLAGDTTRTRPNRWARRILDEYRGDHFCPVLLDGIARRPPLVATRDLMNLLRGRRSRRLFKDVPLTNDEKALICEAAQYAPSSCNRQTLDLIFVEDEELRKKVARSIPGGYQFFHLAPCILILVSDAGDYRYPDDRVVPYVDASAAVQNIYLVCETMGLGCCWGSMFSHGSVIDESSFRKLLRIPDTHLIVASLAVGKSDQFICDIPRDPPTERMHRDYYGSR